MLWFGSDIPTCNGFDEYEMIVMNRSDFSLYSRIGVLFSMVARRSGASASQVSISGRALSPPDTRRPGSCPLYRKSLYLRYV